MNVHAFFIQIINEGGDDEITSRFNKFIEADTHAEKGFTQTESPTDGRLIETDTRAENRFIKADIDTPRRFVETEMQTDSRFSETDIHTYNTIH